MAQPPLNHEINTDSWEKPNQNIDPHINNHAFDRHSDQSLPLKDVLYRTMDEAVKE